MLRKAPVHHRLMRHVGAIAVTGLCIAAASGATGHPGQDLPPPRGGDIRVLHHELRNETSVWLTLEPKLANGEPAPPGMLLTLTLHFPGKWPKTRPHEVEMRAYAGLLWAPQVELSLVIDESERIDLAPQGLVGLDGYGVSDSIAAPVSVATLKRMADARRVRIKALRLELELTESQQDAIRAFLDRVLSENPAQFAR